MQFVPRPNFPAWLRQSAQSPQRNLVKHPGRSTILQPGYFKYSHMQPAEALKPTLYARAEVVVDYIYFSTKEHS
jgi:hypothetical protein